MPEKTITVLLVEDDAEVRRRFETTINQDPMMKVVGFASTKHEAQQLIETLDFEVMVIDLGLPDGSGIDLISEKLAKLPLKGELLPDNSKQGAGISKYAKIVGVKPV